MCSYIYIYMYRERERVEQLRTPFQSPLCEICWWLHEAVWYVPSSLNFRLGCTSICCCWFSRPWIGKKSKEEESSWEPKLPPPPPLQSPLCEICWWLHEAVWYVPPQKLCHTGVVIVGVGGNIMVLSSSCFRKAYEIRMVDSVLLPRRRRCKGGKDLYWYVRRY